MNNELRKFLCPEFVFGENSRLLLDQYINNFGVEKVLIVTDKNLLKYQWYKDVLERLNNTDIDYEIYDNVTINPKDYEVELGAVKYMETDCDMIVAIGGGSVIDCGKGIGILVANGGLIYDYEGVDQIDFPCPPLICIPTTAGSAADVSQFAIITNTVEDYKMAIASKTLVPDLALVDPVVTLTCSYDLTVDTSVDAMVHAIEAYVSNASSFVTDLHAKSAIEKISKYLPYLSNHLDDLEYRSLIMEACLNAGLAFSNASLGLVHAMAHAIGGRLNLVHGELNAMLVEHVVKFNYDSAKDRYDEIASIISKNSGIKEKMITDVLHDFINGIRKNRTINDMVNEKVDLENLAKYVLNDPCVVTNPREVTVEEVVKIYERIF